MVSEEMLEKVSGGKLINEDLLQEHIRERKQAGESLNQIMRTVIFQPYYMKYTDSGGEDIYSLMEYTTNYYNSLPGRKGAFIDGEVIDY